VPSGTIPALVEDDFILAESDTILEYLEDKYPTPALLPRDAQDRARARVLGRLHDLHLEPRIRATFAHVGASTPSLEMRTAIADKLDVLETHLDPVGPYAVGADPSLADCAFPASLAILDALAPLFGWSFEAGPRTKRWRAAIAEHLAFESLLAPYRATVAAWIASKR